MREKQCPPDPDKKQSQLLIHSDSEVVAEQLTYTRTPDENTDSDEHHSQAQLMC
jgi:hypothetical protein